MLPGQINFPRITRPGGIDSSSLPTLAASICARANAQTPREKAEAIWRFFLTDGRYVPPGFWYHIAWWAYEEPGGEVLDAGKLLNSYGFGLCYQIAPLLQGVFEAAGLPARVWFLTGHTVTEVFYDGAYHYYDSDMLGYTPVTDNGFRGAPVASVRQLEKDPGIMLRKLKSPTETKPGVVDNPWYPADLHDRAIGGLAELFSTVEDNWLFPYSRFTDFHVPSFVLRPGEKIVRYYQPEAKELFYLPFESDGDRWKERPREVARYRIFTRDGPRSQRDNRMWGTGRMEYAPALGNLESFYPVFAEGFNQNLQIGREGGGRLQAEDRERPAAAVFEVSCPWVLIDAEFAMNAFAGSGDDSILLETSTDNGRHWVEAGRIRGPHHGEARLAAAVLDRSVSGTRTAVSGTYGYLLRVTLIDNSGLTPPSVNGLRIVSRFQYNPRTLPALEAGANQLMYSTNPDELRRETAVNARDFDAVALHARNIRYLAEAGQGFLVPDSGETGEVVFDVKVPDETPLTGIQAGGQFLDIRDHLAPDKYTAEVRKTAYSADGPRVASLAFATSPEGPYQGLWSYSEEVNWRGTEQIGRLLRWPEVDRTVRSLPAGTRHVYLRYQVRNMGLDSIRFAALTAPKPPSGKLIVRHEWRQNGVVKQHGEVFGAAGRSYTVETGSGPIENVSLTMECPRE